MGAMMLRNLPRPRTLLHDLEPLSEDEKRALNEKRAERSLAAVLAYADYHPSFAESLCKQVADRYGPDDRLSAVLLNRLRVERQGKPRARRKKWDRARLFVLLVHYNVLRQQTKDRREVLRQLASMERVRGETGWKKIEQKITEARKVIRKDELPDFCRPTALRKEGG